MNISRIVLTVVMAAATQGAIAAAAPETAINPVLLAKAWPAWWITHPTASATEFGVFHFRKSFVLGAKPEHFIVHVSADNRYRLYVNGKSVVTGPAQSDLLNWRFETVDLAAHLNTGRNVLAAVVWNGGLDRPMAQITHRTGFILQGDGESEKAVNTDATWRVLQDPAYAQIIYKDNDPRLRWQYYVAGALERLDGARYPWGWQELKFDDSPWVAAKKIVPGAPAGVESHQRWQLRPRSVPLLPEIPQRFARVVRSRGVEVASEFVKGAAPFRVPPHSKAVVLLDNGPLTTGYPLLRLSGGRGSEVRLIYSEALYDSKGLKGNRNEIEGKEVMGIPDVFLPDGGQNREYRPLWTRNWRWLQLEVATAGEALTIEDLSSLLCVYPAQRIAEFESDSESLQQIWDAGWRTLALTAQENFISDLAWERMQYLADTKMQALSWLVTTGDDRLVRLAIEQFDESRVPFGLTQSRYPANLEQFIAPFSLYWISMVHDYWMYRGDDAFIKQFLPGISQVLLWHENHTDPAGMRPTPWAWSPIEDALLLALELDESAELFEHFGQAYEAGRYRQQAADLKRRTYGLAYDPARGLFKDGPQKASFTEEVNSLAILANAVPPEQQRALAERMLKDASIVKAEMFFRYYLGRALKQAGLGDRYIETLGPWQDMLRSGMQTFGEQMQEPRSDCHPWSTSPVFELLSTVAGIEPASPGFRTVRIQPAMGALRHVHARMPHPLGPIEVWLDRDGEHLRAHVSLPAGLTGVFAWKGREKPIRGVGQLSF